MAGLAAITSRIRLYASVGVLTIPPAIVARMASTIADISGGRFGVNIVSGWHKIEYSQMGLWPGDDHFGKRYDYSTEYVRVMQELWGNGHSDFQGEYFRMEACKLSPRPASPIKLVAAGQSDRGMEFAAQYCDFNFALGEGVNEPTKAAGVPARMLAHAQKIGRDVGSYMLYMIIADETDEAAIAKWDLYNQGADLDALEHLLGKVAEDTAPSETSMAAAIQRSASPINFNMGTLVGSYGKVAAMLDEAAEMRQLARQFGFVEPVRPRVIMQFPAKESDMLLSGTIAGGQAIANRPLVLDVPSGKGHIVMFALRPFWRWQTQGTYFLAFNAILNWNHLDAGKAESEHTQPTAAQDQQ